VFHRFPKLHGAGGPVFSFSPTHSRIARRPQALQPDGHEFDLDQSRPRESRFNLVMGTFTGQPPGCLQCGKPMEPALINPKAGDSPELVAFKCKRCFEVVTLEKGTRAG